jgi:non-ribosomal peptide synthetase component F/thioester reductase-like protein/aryl carrier-like protein
MNKLFPLTLSQEMMLSVSLSDNTKYVTSLRYEFNEKILKEDFPKLQERFEILLKRHEILRSSVVIHDGKPFLSVSEKSVAQVYYTENLPQKSFSINPVEDEILIRIYVSEDELLFVFAHILLDGWSASLLLRELFSVETPSGKVTPYSYYLKWLNNKPTTEIRDGHEQAALPFFTESLDYRRDRISFTLENSDEIRSAAANLQVPLGRFIESVWGILCARYTDSDTYIASVDSGRFAPVPHINSIAGMFVSTVPLYIKFDENTRFCDFVTSFADDAADMINSGQTPLVGKINSLISIEIPELTQNERFTFIKSDAKLVTDFDFVVVLDEKISCRFEYNGFCYSKSAVYLIRDHFINLISALISNPQTLIYNTNFLTEKEIKFIHRSSYDKDLLNESRIGIVEKFRKIVVIFPEKTAIICDEKRYSYSDINRLSDSIATSLSDMNIKGGVMIKLPRGVKYVIAELGILKAGCYFIPTDNQISYIRFQEITDIVSPSFIISEENIDELTKNNVEFDFQKISPKSPAYAITTSGTTGKPKAVLVSSVSISHYLAWAKKTYNYTENSSTVLIYGFTFDGSFGSIYSPLLSGGTLHILDDITRKDIFKICEYVTSNGITHIDVPAAMLGEFTKLMSGKTSSLTNIITGGEQIKTFTDCSIPVSNEYGPTETTVCCSQAFLNSNDKIIIGEELPNNKMYVLDRFQNLCPLGVCGECCVSGVQVAIGYIGDEVNASFSKNPFGEHRIYKTGDFVRFIETNNGYALEFIGRKDSQIKLNGYRIETSDIEIAARKFCGIESVACFRDQYIALFAVCENSEKIIEILRKILPSYMIPVVIPVPFIPLKESGKPDLDKLFEYDIQNVIYDNKDIYPECQLLCKTIFEVTGISVLGDDNFIFSGGNSISAMKVSFALKEQGISLSPSDILTSKSIELLSQKLEINLKEATENYSFTPPNVLKSMLFLSEKYGNKIYTVTTQQKCDITREELTLRIKKASKLHDILRCRFYKNEHHDFSAIITESPNICLIGDDEKLPDFINPIDEILIYISLHDGYLELFYHHIILDGFSINLLISELCEGKFPENADSYAEFIISFDSENKNHEFYEKTLENHEPITLFESKNVPETLTATSFFDESFSEIIVDTAKIMEITPAVFMMTVFGIFLCIYGNKKNVYIPVIASFRNSGTLIGCAAQTFPIPIEINPEIPFGDMAKRVMNSLYDTTSHINIPEKYLNLPYIFVDADLPQSLSDTQNYSLVITSGGQILYNEKVVSPSLLDILKRRLKSIVENAFKNVVSAYEKGEKQRIYNSFSTGKKETAPNSLQLKNHDYKASKIAEILKNSHISEGNIVAIEEARTEDAFSSYAGVFLSGAGFLPIDTSLPEYRKDEMISDCRPAAIIKDGDIKILNNKCEYEKDIAYVIYTSGTTGKPKGVKITKSALASQIKWTLDEFKITGNDVVLHYINFAFDPSVWIISTAFASGASLKIVPEKIRISPEKIADFIGKTRATIITLPAAAAYDILDNLRENSLRLIFLGGDKINIPKRTKYTENIEIVNLYGPTETCINATFYRLPKETTRTSCIGRPISNTDIYVLDGEKKRLSPIGIRGEIYIGGDKLSTGYINRPIETDKSFLTIPPFGRLYKTGDIAMWNDDGTIEFLGRADRQVKIRGFRVELSEIESAVMSVTNSSAVVIYENGILAGFTSPNSLSEREILSKLSNILPQYMIPSRIFILEKLPLNSNGKIDYSRLKITLTETDHLPLTSTEKIITEAFEEVLNLPENSVGKNYDFFALGGHSLKLFALTGSLASKGLHISINDIIKYPVVSQIAEKIQKTNDIATISDKDIVAEKSYEDYIKMCETVDISKKRKADTVLITGGTGFLGAHLIREILSKSQAEIFLPVRGDSDRLKKVLEYYFPHEKFDFRRLHIFNCDIAKTTININEKIDIIYHAAADIRHYAPYDESFSANVTATEKIIAFAKQNNAYLAHISTGSAINHKTITENNFDNGEDFENVYQRTKQQAERLVINNALTNYGIYRVGNITPSLRYGIKAIGSDKNAYLHLLKLLIKSRTLPDFRGRSGYCFADLAAEAITLLASRKIFDKAIFHISNPNILTFKNVFEIMGINPDGNADEIPDELRGIYAQRAVEKKSDVSSEIKNTATVTLLNRIGFKWETPDEKYLKAFTDYD